MSSNNIELPNIDNIQQFEALFNHATIGIVITNNRGKIINFNHYVEVQFGLTGVATESLIRTLADFKSENLIALHPGKIIILDENKLKNLPY